MQDAPGIRVMVIKASEERSYFVITLGQRGLRVVTTH